MFYCKSTLNRHTKICHGEDETKEARHYTLKLRVTVKKSEHDIKTILKDAATLLKLNMHRAFQNVELLNGQVLIHFNGMCPKTHIELNVS